VARIVKGPAREMITASRRRFLLVAAPLLLAPAAARAETDNKAPPALGTTETSVSHPRLGLDLLLMPLGSVSLRNSDSGRTGHSTAFAYGVRPSIDWVRPHSFVGFASQLTLNAKESHRGGTEAAGVALDLLLRLGLRARLEELVHVYGYLAPGYSIVARPGRDTASGLVLGAHAGILTESDSRFFWNLEVGYQLGFQSAGDYAYALSYFQVGIGAGCRL
jgi:hypothetical protein